uniref:Venom protein n=1 Tax=Heterorhabditis bacteriophora TaxID=37862 RepID=A0A1I7XLL3_HETBA
MFRCAMFCVLLGSLGKNGQAPLSLLVMNNLSEGPVENIVNNYHRTAEIILCHLELQAKIASNRVAMFTGPLEGVLENQLSRGLRILKKAVNFIRRSIAPFLSDVSEKDTAEDNKLDQREFQLSLVAQRKAIESELNEEEIDSKNARKITSRISKRCNDIFVKGVDKCRDTFTSIKSLNRRLQSIKFCKKHLEESRMSNTMERELDDVVKLTSAVEKEMKINVRL